MLKIYHLGHCTTCQRILRDMPHLERFRLQDIKHEPITAAQLDALKAKVGSWSALFSRQAMNYRRLGLHLQELDEADCRRLILEEYTFLKRPVIVIHGRAYVGHAKKTVEAAQAAARKLS